MSTSSVSADCFESCSDVESVLSKLDENCVQDSVSSCGFCFSQSSDSRSSFGVRIAIDVFSS